jgi:hypothetical protein
MTLESWAKAQAERLIAPLGDRWTMSRPLPTQRVAWPRSWRPRMATCWSRPRSCMTWATLRR